MCLITALAKFGYEPFKSRLFLPGLAQISRVRGLVIQPAVVDLGSFKFARGLRWIEFSRHPLAQSTAPGVICRILATLVSPLLQPSFDGIALVRMAEIPETSSSRNQARAPRESTVERGPVRRRALSSVL